MKHVESRIGNGQMPGGTVPVWLETHGLQSIDSELGFEETAEVLKDIAEMAEILQDPLTAAAKIKRSLYTGMRGSGRMRMLGSGSCVAPLSAAGPVQISRNRGGTGVSTARQHPCWMRRSSEPRRSPPGACSRAPGGMGVYFACAMSKIAPISATTPRTIMIQVVPSMGHLL